MDTISVTLNIPNSPFATTQEWCDAIVQNISVCSARGDMITTQSLSRLLGLLNTAAAYQVQVYPHSSAGASPLPTSGENKDA
ncbi:hypothetical protein [Hyphomicrobium sp. ghe19]|uniref:hypothetical protein n=1 Tax=Hyphomicrobium sp. ghe19 TaxID=2682968 RepID=UPI001366C383|nr:hypothetical protein HYPP_01477 [Hyphomicrobium sp. ghe19]